MNELEKSELIKNWRYRWLELLFEFSHIKYQKGLWVELKYPNRIGSFDEDICQYIDDLGIDDNYQYQLNENFIDKHELDTIITFHTKLNDFDGSNKSNLEILNDPKWQEIVNLGLRSWSKLKDQLSDKSEKEYIINLELKYKA